MQSRRDIAKDIKGSTGGYWRQGKTYRTGGGLYYYFSYYLSIPFLPCRHYYYLRPGTKKKIIIMTVRAEGGEKIVIKVRRAPSIICSHASWVHRRPQRFIRLGTSLLRS